VDDGPPLIHRLMDDGICPLVGTRPSFHQSVPRPLLANSRARWTNFRDRPELERQGGTRSTRLQVEWYVVVQRPSPAFVVHFSQSRSIFCKCQELESPPGVCMVICQPPLKLRHPSRKAGQGERGEGGRKADRHATSPPLPLPFTIRHLDKSQPTSTSDHARPGARP
jgi:hypothetical protein